MPTQISRSELAVAPGRSPAIQQTQRPEVESLMCFGHSSQSNVSLNKENTENLFVNVAYGQDSVTDLSLSVTRYGKCL